MVFVQGELADLGKGYIVNELISRHHLFTYGLETSYFRFAQNKDREVLYNTLSLSLIATTVFLTLMLFLFREPLTSFLELRGHPEYVTWMIWIIFFDTLIVIPMSRLRLEERPARYALVNMASIFINIAIVFFFLFIAKSAYEKDPQTILGAVYDPRIGVGYFILGNLVASAVSLLFFISRAEEDAICI